MKKSSAFYLLLSFTLFICLSLISCDNSGNKNDNVDPNFSREAMLKNIGTNIILPSYTQLQKNINQLQDSIHDFVTTPNAVKLNALRNIFRKAYLSWQNCSFFEFGPADAVVLRGSLNTYPTNSDNIHANIASGSYDLNTISNISSIGFPAIDYLLNGAAASDQEIVALYTYDAMAGNRKTYLQDLIVAMKSKIDQVHSAWSDDGENYLQTFSTHTGTQVGSPISLLSNALIQHYERFTRDGKVGIPLGVRSAGVPRPSTAEARYGGFSVALALENIRAIERLYLGNALEENDNPIGLDDLLVSLGREDLRDNIRVRFTTIIQHLLTTPDPLNDTIAQNPDTVSELYKKLQQLLVLLKTDMASAMGVIITFQDNDGD